LDHYAPGLVNHVLFPLPSAKGKGVLVTMTTSGNYLVGPSSEEILGQRRCFYRCPDPRCSVKAQAKALVPSIPFNQQIRVYAGFRATPSTHDFIIEPSEEHPGVHQRGRHRIPGSSFFSGDRRICDQDFGQGAVLAAWSKKPLIIRESVLISSRLTMPLWERNDVDQRDILISAIWFANARKSLSAKSRMCLSRSVPCLSVKALKKRTRAGFGKCQGGFCQPQVVRLLAEYYHVSPLEVPYDKEGQRPR
jgi:glycerol-3-phosphate dehydrogenase